LSGVPIEIYMEASIGEFARDEAAIGKLLAGQP